MSMIDDEGVSNTSSNEHFEDVAQARLSRRHFLTGGVATAAAMSLGGLEALLRAVPVAAQEGEEAEADSRRSGPKPRLRPQPLSRKQFKKIVMVLTGHSVHIILGRHLGPRCLSQLFSPLRRAKQFQDPSR